MNWISTKYENPDQGGPYIVSISRNYGNGKYVFKYVAYYDVETKTWYKYDPFEDKHSKREEIEAIVLGWVKDSVTYFG